MRRTVPSDLQHLHATSARYSRVSLLPGRRKDDRRPFGSLCRMSTPFQVRISHLNCHDTSTTLRPSQTRQSIQPEIRCSHYSILVRKGALTGYKILRAKASRNSSLLSFNMYRSLISTVLSALALAAVIRAESHTVTFVNKSDTTFIFLDDRC